MAFAELLQYLNEMSGFEALDDSLVETLGKAHTGDAQKSRLLGSIGCYLFERSGGRNGLESPIERADALGQFRLRHMKHDAPADAFHIIEKIIYTIDSALDEETMQEKYRQ